MDMGMFWTTNIWNVLNEIPESYTPKSENESHQKVQSF